MDNKLIFSKNLNYYMDLYGKSRKDVAEGIGVSYFTFTDWVKGKKFPRMGMVAKLAQYFDVSISDLIEERKTEKILIVSNPKETAGFHARILTDDELLESIREYYELSASNQKMVRDLIHNLKKSED